MIDPALAAVGKEVDLGQSPAEYTRIFEEWYEHHHLLAQATGVKDSEQILKLLLLWGGRDFRRFADEAGVITTAEWGDTLEEAVRKIRGKAATHVNLSMAVYELMHSEQGSRSVTQYAKELDERAKQCQFDTVPYTKQRAMRDAFIFGTSDHKLRRDALAQDWSYDKLFKTALSYEQSRKAAEAINTTEEVNRLQAGRYSARRPPPTAKQQSTRGKPGATGGHCPNCPPHYRPHEPGRCPATSKTCMACRKRGHFAGSKNCTSTSQTIQSIDSSQVNSLTEDYTFSIDSLETLPVPVNSLSTTASHTTVVVKFNNTPIKLDVDSQCSKTIIPKANYTADMGTLETSNIRFKPYGTNYTLRTLGAARTTITAAGGATTDTEIYVVEGETHTKPLLGEIDARALGILNINKTGGPLEVSKISTGKHKLENAGFLVQNGKEQHDTMSKTGKEKLDNILQKHKQVFKGIGTLEGMEAKFNIDDTVTPVAAPYRPIPLAYQGPLSTHLQELRDSNKIEDVATNAHTGWVSNVVITEKKNRSIRMNIDMREANKAIKHTPRHVETVQEMRHKMRGAKFFSEMDMSHGFHQLRLAEESQYISTFRTHEGLHKFKVLFFGAAPATDIFHECVQAALEGLEGSASIHDNIITWGNSEEEYLNNVDKCLTRLEEKGFTLRREKCTFGETKVSWFGWIFSPSGMSADPEKIKSILEAGRPESGDDVKSFLQAVQFNARFMLDKEEAYAQMTLPLRKLTHKNARFSWTNECEEAYQKIAEAMSTDTALRYFDPTLKTIMVTDASEVGIAATIYQEENGILKPVDHASRALTETEGRYSAIERESLGQAWGMETHRYYLLGRHFTSYTDHEPLLHIYNGKKKGNSRIERHRIRTQGFKFQMKHIPGKQNPCDYPSRHPIALKNIDPKKLSNTIIDNGEELCISQIDTQNLPTAITLQMIKEATAKDKDLQELAQLINRGYYKDTPKLRPYKKIFTELGYEEGIIKRGDKVVVPKSLERKVVEAAHEGHQGEVKTKQLLRTTCWFPNMNKLVQEEVSACRGCQSTTYKPTRDPLQPTKLPIGPWKDLDSDFKGPLPGGEYLFVVVDEYSRYPEVEIVKSTASKNVLPSIDRIFSTHGFPETFKTDGGPPFNGDDSHSFQTYLKWAGVKHKKVSAEDPEANGLAENFMKNLKKVWHIALQEKKNPQQEMYKFLRQYRATPHCTTGKAPAEILFGRKFKTRIPTLTTKPTNDKDIRDKDAQEKKKQKAYKDRPSNVKPHKIKKGDKVLLLNNKKRGPFWYDPTPYQVINIQGHQITARRGQTTLRRDAKAFKVITQTKKTKHTTGVQHPLQADVDISNEEEEQKTKHTTGAQHSLQAEVDIINEEGQQGTTPDIQEPTTAATTPAQENAQGEKETATANTSHFVRRSTRQQKTREVYDAQAGK